MFNINILITENYYHSNFELDTSTFLKKLSTKEFILKKRGGVLICKTEVCTTTGHSLSRTKNSRI